MTSTEVTPYEASPLSERMAYAETLANAGDLIPRGLMYQPIDPDTMAARGPKKPSPGKILLVMETGAMLGLHPVAALQGIHVIEGKASLAASTMSAVVRQAGHDLKVWTEGSVADGTFKAIATLIRKGETFEYRSEWDMDRATRAGLNEKDNWVHYFEAMCKNRCVSDVCRDGASDTLAGVIYTPDELGAIENDRGDVADLDEVVAAPTAAHAKPPAVGRQGTRKAPKAADPAPEPTHDAPAPETAAQPADEVAADPATGEVVDEPVAVIKERVKAKQAARAATPADAAADQAQADEDLQRQADAADAEEAARLADEAAGIEDAVVVDDGQAAVLADPAAFAAALDEEDRNAVTGSADWNRLLPLTVTVADVKAVWDAATKHQQLTTDLRAAIVARKAEVEAA